MYNIILTKHAIKRIYDRVFGKPENFINMMKDNIIDIVKVKPSCKQKNVAIFLAKTPRGKYYLVAKEEKETNKLIVITFLGHEDYYNWYYRQINKVRKRYVL